MSVPPFGGYGQVSEPKAPVESARCEADGEGSPGGRRSPHARARENNQRLPPLVAGGGARMTRRDPPASGEGGRRVRAPDRDQRWRGPATNGGAPGQPDRGRRGSAQRRGALLSREAVVSIRMRRRIADSLELIAPQSRAGAALRRHRLTARGRDRTPGAAATRPGAPLASGWRRAASRSRTSSPTPTAPYTARPTGTSCTRSLARPCSRSGPTGRRARGPRPRGRPASSRPPPPWAEQLAMARSPRSVELREERSPPRGPELPRGGPQAGGLGSPARADRAGALGGGPASLRGARRSRSRRGGSRRPGGAHARSARRGLRRHRHEPALHRAGPLHLIQGDGAPHRRERLRRRLTDLLGADDRRVDQVRGLHHARAQPWRRWDHEPHRTVPAQRDDQGSCWSCSGSSAPGCSSATA